MQWKYLKTDKLDTVIAKFEALCVGETNETYKCSVFNSPIRKDGEMIKQYATVLHTLCQTCNFCSCLHYSLLCDRIVTSITDELVGEREASTGTKAHFSPGTGYLSE